MEVLDADGIFVLGLTLGLLLLLFFEKASLDAIGLGLIVLITGAGIVDPKTALEGFANKAVLTIGGLYVVGEGLARTGAVDFLGRLLTFFGAGSELRIVLFTCVAAAVTSAFLNDTIVVVVFVPILLEMARKSDIPASRLMIPLAYAALLGGMCTLIGTSTNIIVSGAAEKDGAEPLGMFTLTPVGVPVALACIFCITLLSRFLLPNRQNLTVIMGDTPSREYLTEMKIGDESPLIGRDYADAFDDLGLKLLFYVRQEESFRPPFRNVQIAAGDVVLLRGGIDALADAKSNLDLKMLHDLKIDPRAMELFEIALSPRAPRAGTRVGDLHLHRDFGATTVAVLRAGHHIHERVGRQRLQAGDLLLVCGDEDSRKRLAASPDFVMLAGEPTGLHLKRKAALALLVAAGVVVLLAVGSIFRIKSLPTPVAALAGALAMVSVGALSSRQAYRSIDWSILIFIAGTLCLGDAMKNTGVAQFFARLVVDSLDDFGAHAVVSGIILLCFIFNFLISHSAVAVLFAPIAITAGKTLATQQGFLEGGPEEAALVRAMVLAVCFGGSLCFATPIAHQVNLMVCGPGSYRYRDFLRLGLPVSLVAWIVASLMIPVVTGI